ncbi:MAG: hypothetical protein AAF696_04995 [Bacteroidota bacterium]
MNKLYLISVLFLLFLTSTISCNEEAKSNSEEALSEEIEAVEEEEQKSRSMETSEGDPTGQGLMGKWVLKERKMGVQVLEMLENDKSTLEFLADGKLISESEGFDPESFPFTRTEDLITSDLWDTAQRIKTLTEDELVLVYQVDGVDIDHIYKRMK